MSQAPIGDETAQRFEPPRNVQFSVFLDNRVGKLLELIKIFEGRDPRLAALSVIDSADHAVVRIVTSRSDLARRLLQRNQMAFSETDVLVVELTPGKSLLTLCRSLLSAEINIHYAYPLLFMPHSNSAIVVHTDDMITAGGVLLRKLFLLLGENDLGENATPGPDMTDN